MKLMNEQQILDTQFESLILKHLSSKKDYTNNIYQWMKNHMDLLFKKVMLKWNILNLIELDMKEIKKLRKNTELELSSILTKVTLSIVLFNEAEKYELSQKLHKEMKDLFYFVNQNLDIENNLTMEDIENNFFTVFEKCTETVTNYKNEYLNDLED